MKSILNTCLYILGLTFLFSCGNNSQNEKQITAADILGNSDYLAVSYGGYRNVNHDIEPSLDELKEDMKILSAMGIKVVRTYKVHFPHASNVLKAISELKKEDPNFEMYVMLGAWINCENAFMPDITPNHDAEDIEFNTAQIDEAVELANQYPDIVKIMAVGNEAMVKWAASYYVQPNIILKWVNYLQRLKKEGKLAKDLWITSSDNFASWGGGGGEYYTKDLESLIKAVDYISMHTYPFLDSHYNPSFWKIPEEDQNKTDKEQIDSAMLRARDFAISQYQSVYDYMKSLGVDKPIHIGESGWSTVSTDLFGVEGSRAADEYKQALYYKLMREWSKNAIVSCFYFEAFDEPWKDANNPSGSENHFGLFTVDGEAKYALWDLVDKRVFEGLKRNGNPIIKTYNGDYDAMMKVVNVPFVKEEIGN